MAITTQAGADAGVQRPVLWRKNGANAEAVGFLHSLWYSDGVPLGGGVPAPGLAGAALAGSVVGALPRANPASGNAYLYRHECVLVGGSIGSHFLCDRLWHNSGIAIATTTAQTVNSVAFPARDRNGSTDGVGVMVAMEVRLSTGNAGAITNTTLDYTNSAGVAGRVATIPSFPATAGEVSFIPFCLQAGDIGVRSIQSVTLGTSYVSGAVHLVAYRILDFVALRAAPAMQGLNSIVNGVPVRNRDMYAAGFVRIPNDAVLWFVQLNATNTSNAVLGIHQETHG